MTGEPRISSAPTRSDDKTRSKEFYPLQKFTVVCVVLSALGGIWFFISGQAASTIDVTLSPMSVAETLTTNPALESGLVGHWTFDGDQMDWSSTTAEVRDRSGQGNNGNAIGSLGMRSLVPGVLGQGFAFTSGATDEVVVADDDSISAFNEMTVTMWYRRNATSSANRGVVTHTHTVSPSQSYGVLIDASSTLSFFIRNTTPSYYVNRTTVTLVPGQWYFFVGRYDGSRVTAWLDGVNVSEYTGTASGQVFDGNASLYLNDGNVPADMDDVRIYNRALSAEEISRLYGLGATTHVAETITTNPQLETGLVGHWTFDGDQMDWSSTTAEIRDRSGLGNHGNATLEPTPTAGVLGQALDFRRIVGQKVQISPPPTMLEMGTADWTISAWYKPGSQPDGIHMIVNKGAYDASHEGYSFYHDRPNNALRISVSDGATRQFFSLLNVSLQSGTWYHIVVVAIRDGGVYFYINGDYAVLSGSSVYPGTEITKATQGFGIGAALELTWAFDGSLDDVRVYNRALSAEEVGRLYQLGQ